MLIQLFIGKTILNVGEDNITTMGAQVIAKHLKQLTYLSIGTISVMQT
jgi:hypothetical protein